jgi:hypothetical protein
MLGRDNGVGLGVLPHLPFHLFGLAMNLAVIRLEPTPTFRPPEFVNFWARLGARRVTACCGRRGGHRSCRQPFMRGPRGLGADIHSRLPALRRHFSLCTVPSLRHNLKR